MLYLGIFHSSQDMDHMFSPIDSGSKLEDS